MTTLLTILASLVAGVLGTVIVLRARAGRRGPPRPVTRIDAHLAAGGGAKVTPVKTRAIQRDAQQAFETREATHDLAVLDRLLRDLRDLSGADEGIFWRWVEERQTLVP